MFGCLDNYSRVEMIYKENRASCFIYKRMAAREVVGLPWK